MTAFSSAGSTRSKPLLHNEAARTQNTSDGEPYYTIANGVRLSGVPAFGEARSAEQAWCLVLFIRHSPQITAEERNEIKGRKPITRANPANLGRAATDPESCIHNALRSVVDRAVSTATIQGGCMSNDKLASAVGVRKALQPAETNPLDLVPEKIPFDTPYGPPISLERAQAAILAAVANAKKRDWKMNIAVVDSGGNLVAFQRMDGAMLASIQIAEHKARAAATFRRPTKVFEDGINLLHLNYLLAFDGVIASRGGTPLIEKGSIIGAIGVSGGTDSQDEIVSKAGAAVVSETPASDE